MKFLMVFLFLGFLFIFAQTLFAQENSEFEKKAIEEILVDVEKIEDSYQRLIYLSKAGKYLCKYDKNRAEKIFQRAISDLIQTQNKSIVANKDKPDKSYRELSFRSIIILAIAGCNPELAYKYLFQTRPQFLARNLENFYKDPSAFDNKIQSFLTSEISIESDLQRRIIKINPKRVSEFIEHELETILTYQTIELIRILLRENPNLAIQVFEKIVNKIVNSKFYSEEDKKPLKNGYLYIPFFASYILSTLGNEKVNKISQTRVPDKTLSSLAFKIIIESIKNEYIYLSGDLLDIIKRFYPDKVFEYEQMKSKKLNSPEEVEKENFRKITDWSTPYENLLENAKNFSETYQPRLYRFAACKLVYNDQINEAKTLLESQFPDNFYTDKKLSLMIYIRVFESLYAKDYEIAERLTMQIPDPQLKIDALSLLAEVYYKNNLDKEKAVTYLKQAEKIVSENPQEINYFEAMSDIITSYATVAPEIAFPMFDKLHNQTDFSKNRSISLNQYRDYKDLGLEGHFGLKTGFNYNNIVLRLKKISFQKTLEIINKNKSPLARASTKSELFESFVSDFGSLEISRHCKS